MDHTSSFAIVVLAALIHASFQLSVSVLTLMSGHAIGSKQSHTRLLRLTTGYTIGAGVMTMLLLSFTAYLFGSIFGSTTPLIVWAACCGVLVGLGLSVWLFYYRPNKGTSLWLPRGIADYLQERSKATKRSVEAFGLGLSSVIAELLFVVAPIIISALVLLHLEPEWQLAGIVLYTLLSLIPLFVVSGLIGSGHKLSGIQRWREKNKHFMQFVAGSGLLILGFYLYVDQVISISSAPGMY